MKLLLKELVIKKTKIAKDKVDVFIRAGQIFVNDTINIFPNDKVDSESTIRIKRINKWVSRGAYKLLYGIEKFHIDVNNCICIDIGSSTGGFTDVLLSKGAKKVYCIDSGYNQLNYKLRKNIKTIVMEKTNLKSLTKSMFYENINLIVSDVSFISLRHVFIVAKNLLEKGKKLLVLIKPEFEANSNLVKPGGYVEEHNHMKIIENIITFAETQNFKNISTIKSPILGKKSKNIEYLSIFQLF